MDHLLGAFFEVVFGTIFVATGRVIVAVFSLGRWRGASPLDNEEKIYGRAGALSFVREGRRVVTTNGTCLLGFCSTFWWLCCSSRVLLEPECGGSIAF